MSTEIKGMEGLTVDEINQELDKGAKFVMYQYCISIIFMTFKNPTAIYFVKSDDSAVAKGAGFTLLSFVFGWWGFPWGPIYTVGTLINNLAGGKNVTAEVLASLNAASAVPQPAEQDKAAAADIAA